MCQLRSEYLREKVFHLEFEIGLVEPEWDPRGYQRAGDSLFANDYVAVEDRFAVGDPEI